MRINLFGNLRISFAGRPVTATDGWLTPLRGDYWRRISEVSHRLATLFEEPKEYAAAIPCPERLVGLDSLCESHHQLLIRRHAAQSRPLERAARLPPVHARAAA